jgi:hypothetical protein
MTIPITVTNKKKKKKEGTDMHGGRIINATNGRSNGADRASSQPMTALMQHRINLMTA